MDAKESFERRKTERDHSSNVEVTNYPLLALCKQAICAVFRVFSSYL